MNKRKLIVNIGLMSMVAVLSGGVFATFSISDEAPKLGFGIHIQNIEYVDVVFKDYEGNEYAKRTVASGSTLGDVPSDPTLSGYTFDGWSTNSTTYEATSDDLETKTYTVDTTYYPRFASYGYKTSTGNATHLPNKWDINGNVEFAAGTLLTLGTYIYGKSSSLENATSQVTLSNGGEYALVCGESEGTAHESAWNKTYASNLNNWFIQKYITLTRNEVWTNTKLFAHAFLDGDHKRDIYLSTHETTNYAYIQYNYPYVTFGALYNDNNSSINPDWSNVQYKSKDITIGNRTSVVIPNKARSLWDPSEGEYYRVKFALPNWTGVYRPRVHYWYNNGSDYNVDYESGLFNYEASSNMTLLSGSTYYLDIDTKLPISGLIIIFDQWENNSKHVKRSNDIAITALNGAGNYTINDGGYGNWSGETWSGDVGTNQFNTATLTKDS